MRVGHELVKAKPKRLNTLSCARVSMAVENWMARFSPSKWFISPKNENLLS